MNTYKKAALDAIAAKGQIFCDLSEKIWELAELSLLEYRSADAYCALLRELGFSVTEKLCDIPTAFCGSYGSGKPIIGILGEFDALSGLSQCGGVTEKKELVKGGSGHGCGHNLLGAGALAAAYGIKCYLEETKASGTVIFFGTPGEEGGAGKAFMAKEKLWYGIDCALTWHPADVNQIVTGTCNSCIQTLYKFAGTASHAAGNPESGRSALDAIELMNIGVQFLREHTKDDARIHYAILDGGGVSPNVVQPTASVLYMVRSKSVSDALALQARVDKIAEGAAMMTETAYEKIFIDGCSGTVPNHTLEALMHKNFTALGPASYTEDEIAYATALKSTYAASGNLPSIAAAMDPEARKIVKVLSENGTKPLNDFVAPLYAGDVFEPGSTDVGDVSWQTPTAQLHAVCFPADAPGHSWQNVACGKTSIAHKGLLSAASVLAATAIDLLENPAILQAAKDEFQEAAATGYVCPIPENEYAKPVTI